jgi:hypothetical protein
MERKQVIVGHKEKEMRDTTRRISGMGRETHRKMKKEKGTI